MPAQDNRRPSPLMALGLGSTGGEGEMDEPGLLAAVGLTDVEESVYRDVVKWNGGTVQDIAERAHLSERRARAAISALERKGLVGRSSRPAGHYVPAPPESALEILVLRRAEELERVRLVAAQLKPMAAPIGATVGSETIVEIVDGWEAITNRHYQLMLSATTEIMGFAVAPIEPVTDQFVDFKLALLGRGITARSVCAVDVLRTPGFVDFVEAVGRLGEQTRTTPSLPMPMLIVDRRSALVPLPSDREHGYDQYVALKASALVDALIELFEKVWADASPFRPGAAPSAIVGDDHSLTGDDLRLLALLASGLKDTAIARTLGMAQRTVERRVRHIMDVLGTTSRFQTGVEAARRGWLDQ